jgi:nucleoside-diphosphate-sugar epimerase
VLDAALGTLQVLLKGTPGEVYNLGVDAPETSIRELAMVIAGLFGRTEPVKTACDPAAAEIQGSPDRACPDLSKLRALGFAPRVPLAEGLKRSVAWFRQVRATEAAR